MSSDTTKNAHHDPYVNSGVTPFTYNHGYINLAARWRTVMAYNTQCSATAPYTYCAELRCLVQPRKDVWRRCHGHTVDI